MWNKIEYREFWDVPRLFIVRHDGKVYLFNSRFDKEKDDYPDIYKIYLFQESDTESKNWEEKLSDTTSFLGEIKITDVKFDATRRKEISSDVFSKFKNEK